MQHDPTKFSSFSTVQPTETMAVLKTVSGWTFQRSCSFEFVLFLVVCMCSPEGPSAQYFRTLVPNTIQGMVFGTRVLKHGVLGPSG